MLPALRVRSPAPQPYPASLTARIIPVSAMLLRWLPFRRPPFLRQNAAVFRRLTARNEWMFFTVLPKRSDAGSPRHGGRLLLLEACCRPCSPSRWACSSARCSAAIRWPGRSPSTGVIFVLLQVLEPDPPGGQRQPRRSHRGVALRPAHRRVRAAAGHRATSKIRSSTSDLTVARDFDLGMTGPPLSISMDFIASGMVEMVGGLASRGRARGVRVVGADRCSAARWLATHWLLRESAVWRDRNTDEVRGAQRDADYAYRLAVDPPASKELRLFGLADWTIDRFVAAPHAPARAAVRGDAAARAAGASGACCSSSPPTSSCSGRSRAPPRHGRICARRRWWCSCRARSACR